MKLQHSFKATTLICLAFVAILSCNKSDNSYNNNPQPNPPSGPPVVNISMSYMAYAPATRTVAKGSIVKWTNNDTYVHTVTSDDGVSFDSKNIPIGSTYSYTASAPGTYYYHCTIHGSTMMSGTLIVNP